MALMSKDKKSLNGCDNCPRRLFELLTAFAALYASATRSGCHGSLPTLSAKASIPLDKASVISVFAKSLG